MNKSRKNKTVFVGMSGGVDSSVAAALLKDWGYNVVGIHLRCFNVDGCAARDAEDARRAAETLNIPFYTLDFEEEYKAKVVNYMVDGYKQGITPNPDVMCNREIKFGLFLKKALEMGADYVATGHYVRLRRTATSKKRQATSTAKKPISHVAFNKSLFVARDKNKDQSYFLWTLTEKDLAHCLFPIGDYTKPQVRKLAKKYNLPNAEKKDSQGICFLGEVTLSDFLKDYIPEKKGAVVTETGEKIGEHMGAHFYTIGQRHIGISNTSDKQKGTSKRGNTEPLYVAGKNIETNEVIVAEGSENPTLYRKEINLANVNFINQSLEFGACDLEFPVLARVRYRQPLTKAMLKVKCDTQSGKTKTSSHSACRFSLKFDQPVKFVAEGQSAVFYKYDKASASWRMLGGGVIV